MNGWNQENNQAINNLDKARMLRQEAMLLEAKERVRSRLVYLMNISEDAFYSRYLEQMLKDLESGKASPAQVEREAARSYDRYRQKMAQTWNSAAEASAVNVSQPVMPVETGKLSAEREPSDGNKFQKSTIEFKIGMHVFSVIGAVFVLSALAILGFQFFGGIGTMAVMLLISAVIIFAGKKKESAALRIIGLVGCYASFFLMREFETEFNFLAVAGMLLIVNGISIFFQNQKHQILINIVHILVLVFGTLIFTGIAWSEEIHSVYLAFYVVTSFLLLNVLSLRQCMGKEESVFPACCIGNVIFLFLLFLIGYFGPEMTKPDMALFMNLTVGILLLVVCLVTFLLWEKTDDKRWAQLYYAAGTVFLFGSFSEYPLEILLSGLGIFMIVKLVSGYKANIVLDCLMTLWTGILCYRLTDSWYCWVLAGALILSSLLIKHMYIYHEIVITLSLLIVWGVRYHNSLRMRFALDSGWFYVVSAGILLFLFLLFNHLPQTGKKNQQVYNIINVIISSFYYLGIWFCRSYIFSSIMMILGAVMILVVFRSRYRMAVRGKYLVLAGFLTWFSLTGHYELPVVASILLMVIALGCVGIGFKFRSKAERICGLVMAVFVCLKLVLYDFREVEIIYRVMVFFVVGVIALMISYIYVRLEKSIELAETSIEPAETGIESSEIGSAEGKRDKIQEN